jgi:hypothetical protein
MRWGITASYLECYVFITIDEPWSDSVGVMDAPDNWAARLILCRGQIPLLIKLLWEKLLK